MRLGWLTFAKLIIAVALLAALAKQGALQFDLLWQLYSSPAFLILSYFTIAIIFPFSAWRWHRLLLRAGLSSDFHRTNAVNYKAAFVGMFLPGGVGADIARLLIQNNHESGRIALITSTIVVDRVLGVLGLLFIGFCAALIANQTGTRIPTGDTFDYWLSNLPLVIAIALLLFLAAILSLLAILWLGKIVLPSVSMMRRFDLSGQMSRLHGGLVLYRSHPRVLVEGFAISVLVHFLDLISLIFIAEILLNLTVSQINYAIAGALAAIVSALPLTPGGIGVGEAAYAQSLNWLEPEHSGAPFATVYIAHRIIRITILLPAMYILLKKGRVEVNQERSN